MLSGMPVFNAFAAVVISAFAVGGRPAGSLERLRIIAAVSVGGICGLMSAGEVGVP